MAKSTNSITITFQGFAGFERMVQENKDQIPTVMGEAFYAEAQTILNDSKDLVPFLTGALSSSGRVHDPFRVGEKVAVEITYGGASGGGSMVNYAIEQHQNEFYRHAEGRQAYYLFQPALEHLEGMEKRLAGYVEHIIARNAARQAASAELEG